MRLFDYNEKTNTFLIFYPRITISTKLEATFDGGKAVVFKDPYDMKEFVDYLEDNSVDVSELVAYSFGGCEETAFMLNDLLKLK
jgi:hypothetical protein